jgi:hypothetical protein
MLGEIKVISGVPLRKMGKIKKRMKIGSRIGLSI